MKLVLATRKSALALAQSRAFGARLAAAHTAGPLAGLTVDELQIVTSGDKNQQDRLQDIGGKGLFVKELEEALFDGRADFAVHSIKDVPAEVLPGLALGCIPEREDPRDALITRSGAPLAELPQGAKVGTTSLRRAVCLRLARPDLVIEPLRGNVDTRLRKLDEGQFDAIVLAYAGLRRLDLAARATEVLSVETSVPAIGQGALGIEHREADERTRAALSALDHEETAIAVTAERALMAAVGGNCRLPVAAYARRVDGDRLWLTALLADPDGQRPRKGERRAAFPTTRAEAAALGEDLGRELAG